MPGTRYFFVLCEQVSSNPRFTTILEENMTVISISPEDKVEVWDVKCLLTQ